MMQQNKKLLLFYALAYTAIAMTVSIGSWQLIRLHHEKQTPIDMLFSRINAPHRWRIAFFMGADIPALNRLQQGALDCIKAYHLPHEVRTFYYNQNKALLTHQVNETLNSKYDLLVPIGTIATQVVHNLVERRKSRTPFIFSGIGNPQKAGISQTRLHTGYTSTGFSESTKSSVDAHIAALKAVRPQTRSALLVYTPTVPVLEEQASQIIAESKKVGIQIKTIEIFETGEVYKKVRAHVTSSVDAVIILREYNTTGALQALLKLCKENNTTLFCADKYSVEQGAAAGYCVDEYDLGLILGTYIQRVLQEKEPIETLPIMYLNTSKLCRLHINPFTMREQGVAVPLKKLLAIPRVSMVQH